MRAEKKVGQGQNERKERRTQALPRLSSSMCVFALLAVKDALQLAHIAILM